MADLSELASFAALAGLLTIIPGLDTALVVRTAAAQGRRRGFAAAVGITTGCLIWGAAAAVGISALLVASRLAYDIVRAAGAAYLIWIGTAMLWRTLRRSPIGPRDGTGSAPAPPDRGESVLHCWFRGTATNLLNPKIGAFYVAMLPQFIPAHAPHLLMGLALAGIHDVEGLIWFTVLISAVHFARGFLGSSRAHKIMDGITGTVLIGFGLRLARSSH